MDSSLAYHNLDLVIDVRTDQGRATLSEFYDLYYQTRQDDPVLQELFTRITGVNTKDIRSGSMGSAYQEVRQLAEQVLNLNIRAITYIDTSYAYFSALRRLTDNSRPLLLGSYTRATADTFLTLNSLMHRINKPIVIDPLPHSVGSHVMKSGGIFLQSEAPFLPLPDNSVSSVQTTFLFHYVNKYRGSNQTKEFIREIYRVLSPGGIAIIVDNKETCIDNDVLDLGFNYEVEPLYKFNKREVASSFINTLTQGDKGDLQSFTMKSMNSGVLSISNTSYMLIVYK